MDMNFHINDKYLDVLEDIWKNGEEYSPRGKKIKELLCYKVILNPNDNIITVDGLETKKSYADEELNWYLSGSNRIDYSPLIEKVWKKYSDDGETVNSAYGYYIFNLDIIGKYYPVPKIPPNQWEWVKAKLGVDRDTRQAVININSPVHKKIFYTKDFPCTISMQFFIRNNKLVLVVNMRSNDIYFGFRNDIYCFTELQKLMAKELNIECGDYIHIANSMHLYEEQFDKVREVLNKYERLA